MNIKSVGNEQNTINFGAKIKLNDPKIRELLNYRDTLYAKEILDKFEAYRPDQKIEMRLEYNKNVDDLLCAKNTSNGHEMRLPIFSKLYKDCNNLENCNSFYIALRTLLDKTWAYHDDFWGKAPEQKAPMFEELQNHSVFV